MEQHPVHIERGEITDAEPIDPAGDVCKEFYELRLVIGGYLLAGFSTRFPLGHPLRLVPTDPSTALALIAAGECVKDENGAGERLAITPVAANLLSTYDGATVVRRGLVRPRPARPRWTGPSGAGLQLARDGARRSRRDGLLQRSVCHCLWGRPSD